jgi:hypothetical protein
VIVDAAVAAGLLSDEYFDDDVDEYDDDDEMDEWISYLNLSVGLFDFVDDYN